MSKKPNSGLKKSREKLLLSINETHEALNIDKEYLRVLEDQGVKALEEIIAPVYAHSYNKIYKQYLSLQEENTFPNLEQPKRTKKHSQMLSTICVLALVGALLII
jgi:cytoskeletal protein RodZ